MTHAIKKVAVIGAGTMGGGIAAHIANAGLPVVLLDIAPTELTPEEQARGLTLESKQVRNRIVNAGLERVKQARPPALFTPERARLITVGNLTDDLGLIADADWIVEAIVEQLEPKRDLMARIEQVRKPGSIVSSNSQRHPDRRDRRRPLGGVPPAFPRHPLLQPAALPLPAGGHPNARYVA